jgi:NADPH-dependent ferric siderophore reductase
MRALRQYFRNEKQVKRENIYISSYWKLGVSEDGHKTIKQQDAEEQGA